MKAAGDTMKTYRLITLLASVLITVLIARVLTDDEKISASADQPHATVAQVP
jgi:hypothetical protein